MRKIFVGFSTPKKFNPLSGIIRFFMKTDYSHVYMKSMTKLGLPLIYQASGLQVNFIGANRFNSHHQVIKEFEFMVSDPQYDSFMAWAINTAGTPYGVAQLFKMLWYILTGHKIGGDGADTIVCSEFAIRGMGELFGNIALMPNDLDAVTPKDVFNLCEELSEELDSGSISVS